MRRSFKFLSVISILALLLAGCKEQGKVKPEPSQLTSDQWGFAYESGKTWPYFSSLQRIIKTEHGFLYISRHNGSNGQLGYLLENLSLSGELTPINSNPDVSCSETDYSNCTGYMKISGSIYAWFVYLDQIYYYVIEDDAQTDETVKSLYSMNLDGTQRKKVVEIDRNLQTNMGESINSGQAMLFHLGKFYVVSEDSVRRFDVKSWREEQYGSALDKAESLFFVGFNQEELLLQVATYNDGTNHYANSLIAYDPYTDTVRVVKQDLPLDITVYDDSFIVGTTSSADHYTTFLTDETGAQYKLADDSGPAFFDTNYVILQFNDGQKATTVLADPSGQVLGSNTYDGILNAQGLYDGVYLAISSDGKTMLRCDLHSKTLDQCEIVGL